ncbi:porin [Halomonas sp. SSL-5]|uniref:porin n=1 Tax=Halomonas sp. SSL-5 TaxID=3065855 RepID=UPI0027388191|nr:porin [Halomonas sp. SSL-5]MDY7116475.1 porin [Halomonas sp. SSL-5]
MKKLLLAAAVAVASGSAHAATIYQEGGFEYKLNGDFQVQLRQKSGDDKDPDIEFDDLELKNYVSYQLNDDMTAFGRVDFGFKDAANDEDDADSGDLEEAYLGMAFGGTSISVGKQNFAGDEFGIEEAIELHSKEDRFDAVSTDGDDVIRIDSELGNVYLAASYELESEGNDSENGEAFDLFASTEFGGLELAAAYQEWKENDETIDTWGVSAAYGFGILTLAADYSESDSDLDNYYVDSDNNRLSNAEQYNLAAVFAAAETTDIAIGMTETSYDDLVGDDDVTEWYANVTYAFPAHKNVTVFAEIADTDEENADVGYLAGMRIKF